jgi:hypothetical protein
MSLLDDFACVRSHPASQIVARQKADEDLQEALRLESRLWDVLADARKQRNFPGYNRDHAYARLKAQWSVLVGFEAENHALRTMRHYDAFLRAVDEWLPSDYADLDLDRDTYDAWRAEAGLDEDDPHEPDEPPYDEYAIPPWPIYVEEHLKDPKWRHQHEMAVWVGAYRAKLDVARRHAQQHQQREGGD